MAGHSATFAATLRPTPGSATARCVRHPLPHATHLRLPQSADFAGRDAANDRFLPKEKHA